jgi:hypothetical protein
MSASKMTTEEFVKAWMDAYRNNRSLKQLADQYHAHNSSMSARAGRLRQRGVNLPKLRHANKGNKFAIRYDIEGLKKLTEEQS